MKKSVQNNVTVFELDNGLKVYKLPISTPFPVGKINAYLIEADEAILIDTGPQSEKSLGQLEDYLSSLRMSLSDIRHVVITHGHMDHHGQIKNIQERAHPKVYVHALDKPKVERFVEDAIATLPRFRAFLVSCGLTEQVVDMVMGRHISFRKYCGEGNVHVSMEDGDTVTPLGLRVIHTPGHQEGSVCLALDSVLFTGDNVLAHITPNPFCRAILPQCGLKNYIESLGRLKKEFSSSFGLPGHGKEIENLGERMDKILTHHQMRGEQVLSACLTEKTTLDIAMSPGLFENVKGPEIFLALIETRSHLEYLQEKKQVETFEKEGVTYYKKI